MLGLISTRFSDNKQIGGVSIATQLESCKQYCKTNDIEVIDVQREEAESAKSSNVARLTRLLDFCRKYKGKVGVLVVYKVDRFARDVTQHYFLKKSLLDMGIVLRSATEPIDESPQGKLMETMLAGFAEFDNSIKRERVKAAMWQRVKEGLYPWNAPTGYKPNRIEGVKLSPNVIDTTCSQDIIDMFNLHSTGNYTMFELSKEFKKRDVRNYKGRKLKLPLQSIYQIITNPYYCGLLKDLDGKLVKGKHEALISPLLYNKCQGVIKYMSHNNDRKRSYFNPDFPLRHFVKCMYCGSLLTACWSKSSTGAKHAYYYCRYKPCRAYSKMIRRGDLDDLFVEYLKSVKPTKEFIDRFEERFTLKFKNREQEIRGDYLKKMQDITTLEKEMNYYVTKGAEGVLPDHIVKEKVSELDQKISLSKLQLQETHQEELNLSVLMSYVRAFITKIDLYWYDAHPEVKARLQRSIFPDGVSYGNNTLSNPRITPVFEVIGVLGAKNYNNVTLGRIELPSRP